MVISISYMPSNAVSAYISNQVQLGAASQNDTTQADPLATAQNTSAPPQTDASQISSASVITQLSVAGQVKSTLADLQDKAVALKSISKSPNIADFQMIVQGFAQAFNSLNKNIKELVSKQASTDNRPSQALYDVRKAATGNNALTSLQKLGITPQANGTLSINKNQLAKSYQEAPSQTVATITNLAKRIAQAADKHLSSNSAEKQITSRAADAQATSRTRDAQGGTNETQAASSMTVMPDTGNATEPQAFSGTAETQPSGNTAGDAIIDKQVNAALDKQMSEVSAYVSQADNTGSSANTNSAETREQQPVQPSSQPTPLPPPVQTPAPVSNTAQAAVATYTSVAAI